MQTRQRVVHVKRDPFTHYIGRGRSSRWGNPFKVGHHGLKGECVGLFRDWIVQGEGRSLLPHLAELRDQTLGCWCAPKGGLTSQKPWICHGQVLIALLRHLEQKQRARNQTP